VEIEIREDADIIEEVIEAVEEEVEETQEVEDAALRQGLILGQLIGTVEALVTRVEQMAAAIDAAEANNVEALEELLAEVEAADVIEAEAELVEAQAELVEAEAEAEVTEAAVEIATDEAMNDTYEEEEVTPGSRLTHWYYRPRSEFRRD
jgi:TolA-binding protein